MRTHNYIFATLFGIVGAVCLFSAIFLGATHQLFMAAIGLGMASVLLAENKKMKRHAKR